MNLLYFFLIYDFNLLQILITIKTYNDRYILYTIYVSYMLKVPKLNSSSKYPYYKAEEFVWLKALI